MANTTLKDSAVFIMDDVEIERNDRNISKQSPLSANGGKAQNGVHEKRPNTGKVSDHEQSHTVHPGLLSSISMKKHSQHIDQLFTVGNEAHHSLVDSHETVTLSWENVNVYVNPKKRMCCRGPDPSIPTKHVLRDVYGHVKPGTLLAIIGASGSGKTTLLNTLTSRVNRESLKPSGDIRVNGVDVGSGIRNISAYVQQDDLFIATMTVKEHLTFRALLRMENEVPRKRRLERVDEVIKELGLQKCEDNIIGDPGRIKGISGGEMRRLSFASEILTNPPLMFCDEPTSGLDSFMAENIVQLLSKMANKGKTVLCTIHQPSSEVFALFHNVLVMAEGRVAFMGDAQEALNFYKNAGYPCPVNYNPADFYIMTMAVVPGNETECKERIEKICDQFEQTEISKAIKMETQRVEQNPKRTGIIFEEAFSSTSRYESSWPEQFAAVFARSWKTTIREPMVIRVRVIQTIMLAIILGLIYLQLDIDQQGVMNINGVLFLTLTNMTFSNVFGVLNSFPLETPIFLREYGVGLYRVDVYFMCKCLAELPSFIIIPIAFCAITYWMVGLYASFTSFLIFTGILLLVANTSVSFGYIVSAASNSVTTALAIAPPLMIPLLMFGGFFLNSDSIPVYFIWLEHLSWFKYANELIAINQWDNIGEISCTANVTAGGRCLYQNGAQVLTYLNFTKDDIHVDFAVLGAMLVGYRFIAYIILFIKARRSKN